MLNKIHLWGFIQDGLFICAAPKKRLAACTAHVVQHSGLRVANQMLMFPKAGMEGSNTLFTCDSHQLTPCLQHHYWTNAKL